jgi:hypothetical protein
MVIMLSAKPHVAADEQDVLSLCRHLADETRGVFEHLQSLLQVDNVDTVTFAEDILLHLRIPALGLVPEVNAGFEQFLHRYCWQTTSSIYCAAPETGRHCGFPVPPPAARAQSEICVPAR